MSDSLYLYGFHAVTARMRQHPDSVRGLYVTMTRHDPRMQALIERAEAVGITIHQVDDERMRKLAGDAVHQGVVAIVEGGLPRRTLEEVLAVLPEPALLLILDGVTDPHNLGACLRSADAFGAQAVIVPKDRAAGVTATVAKAASGAAEAIPVISVTNLARTMRDLKERGVWLLGADAGGDENLFEADLSGPVAWVLGAEGTGLRRLTRESCDRLVSIPLAGAVASLNVSVAAGICLFATRRQRALASK